MTHMQVSKCVNLKLQFMKKKIILFPLSQCQLATTPTLPSEFIYWNIDGGDLMPSKLDDASRLEINSIFLQIHRIMRVI